MGINLVIRFHCRESKVGKHVRLLVETLNRKMRFTRSFIHSSAGQHFCQASALRLTSDKRALAYHRQCEAQTREAKNNRRCATVNFERLIFNEAQIQVTFEVFYRIRERLACVGIALSRQESAAALNAGRRDFCRIQRKIQKS